MFRRRLQRPTSLRDRRFAARGHGPAAAVRLRASHCASRRLARLRRGKRRLCHRCAKCRSRQRADCRSLVQSDAEVFKKFEKLHKMAKILKECHKGQYLSGKICSPTTFWLSAFARILNRIIEFWETVEENC